MFFYVGVIVMTKNVNIENEPLKKRFIFIKGEK